MPILSVLCSRPFSGYGTLELSSPASEVNGLANNMLAVISEALLKKRRRSDVMRFVIGEFALCDGGVALRFGFISISLSLTLEHNSRRPRPTEESPRSLRPKPF